MNWRDEQIETARRRAEVRHHGQLIEPYMAIRGWQRDKANNTFSKNGLRIELQENGSGYFCRGSCDGRRAGIFHKFTILTHLPART